MRPGPLALDIAGLEVDWYAANLHKWCFAPRSCGILWAAPERQAALHPGVISWGITNDDWLQEFEWTGTRDPSPWLAAPAGLDFMRDMLGVAAMRELQPRPRLAQRAPPGRALGHGPGPRRKRWSAAWSPCRCPARLGPASVDNAQRLRDALFFGRRIEVPVIARGGALWARLSMQVYNDDEDVERFAEAVESLIET